MGKLRIVTIDPNVLEELRIKSDHKKRILDKNTRFYVEIGTQEKNWYIPMRANIKELRRDFVYPIEANLKNTHLVSTGLDFNHALYVPRSKTVEARPKDIRREDWNKQIIYMEKNWDRLGSIDLFPEGVESIRNENQKVTQADLSIKDLINSANMKGIDAYCNKHTISFLEKENFFNYLNFLASFSMLYFKNINFILAQKPTAQCIYSLDAWEKMGREVKANPEALYYKKELLLKKEENQQKTDYCLLEVFDVSELAGNQEVPKPSYYLKEHTVDDFHYKVIFKSLSELGMVTIKFEDINKDFIFATRTPFKRKSQIIIKKGIDQKKILSILTRLVIHEKRNTTPDAPQKDVDDLKSEIYGYIMAKRIGLATDCYSFDFLSTMKEQNWSPEKVDSFLSDIISDVKKINRSFEISMEKLIKQEKTTSPIDRVTKTQKNEQQDNLKGSNQNGGNREQNKNLLKEKIGIVVSQSEKQNETGKKVTSNAQRADRRNRN
ncbi:hypothetical protein [Enterococcus durans]|uniref:hypothetical protein n=1 Tax=Enterococcus durans TaxID=53345 RepID=UPI0039A6155C